MPIRKIIAPVVAIMSAILSVVGAVLNAQQVLVLGITGAWWLAIGLVVFSLSVGALLWTHVLRPTLREPSQHDQVSAPTVNPSSLRAKTHFSSERVILTDLLIPETAPIISDKTFDNCDIIGPAIIAPSGTGLIVHSSFDGDLEATFYEAAEGRRLVGVVGLKDCVIRNSRFHRIGLIGTKAQIAVWRTGFRATARPSAPGTGESQP